MLTSSKKYGILYEPLKHSSKQKRGSIAQLGEHLPYKQRVTGSSPVVPTKKVMNASAFVTSFYFRADIIRPYGMLLYIVGAIHELPFYRS